MKFFVIVLLLTSVLGCSSHQDEIFGVVNGKTIRAREVQRRLELQDSDLQKASMDQKRAWFETVVREIAIEDEAQRSKFSESELFRFFGVIEQIEISSTERASFLASFPELKSTATGELDRLIKADRRKKVEASYREQILKRTAYEFMADNPKRSKVQNFWDAISN